MNEILKLLESASMPAATIFALFLIIQWAQKYMDKVLIQSENREKAFMGMIECYRKSLDDHTVQAREFHAEVRTAHDYQRQEHEKQIQILDGIKDAVGRINGYKK